MRASAGVKIIQFYHIKCLLYYFTKLFYNISFIKYYIIQFYILKYIILVYHIYPYRCKFATVMTQNGICVKYMQHMQHLLGSYFLCLVWDIYQIFSVWHISHIYCGCSRTSIFSPSLTLINSKL